MKRVLICATILTASLGFATFCADKAHADEGAYLAELQAHGIPFLMPAKAVSDGYRVCAEIRAGESPATAAQTFGIYYNVVGGQIVDIAQRNLCPDTLR